MNLAIRETAKYAVAVIACCDVMWKNSYGQGETKDNQGHEIWDLPQLNHLLFRDADRSEVSILR